MPRRVSNPPNPWESTEVEWIGEPPPATLEVYEEDAKSVLSRNDSPDLPFRWSLNPYRGCFHACAYCYARPTHQYLGFGAGTDFDRRIVVKRNAPEVLSLELGKRTWKYEPVTLSGNTDCYQPLEASYRLTRRCLEIFRARRSPVVVITKSVLVRRDVDVLLDLARGPGTSVFVSIPFLDERHARALEPQVPPPSVRFDCLRALSDAGIPTGVSLAPLIPGLNESDGAAILERAADCGAKAAFQSLLRLPAEVLPVFEERMRERLPERAERVRNALRDARGGQAYDPRFGVRMAGVDERWKLARQMFEMQCRRFGLNEEEGTVLVRRGQEPREGVEQGGLFDDS